jgi:hypothetical protein
LVNGARGEVLADLGGQKLRLCVTLRALAQMESHFGVRGLEALGARLAQLTASDVLYILTALMMDKVALEALPISLNEAVRAIVLAFEAMNDTL